MNFKNPYLKTYTLFLALFFIFASSALVAQQSDFQIQQDFRAELAALNERVELAVSTQELEELQQELVSLRNTYSEHSAIINAAIYPDTFEASVNRAEENRAAFAERYEVIEQLNERVDELSAEMDVFRDRINQMTLESEDLQDQIERSAASESRQAALIRQYRQNIELRDSFVSDFLAELLMRYQTMDRSNQEELSETTARMDDNPLQVIKTIIAEYINVADQSSALETPDYLGMRAQHGYFSDVWERIGERLVNTFDPERPVQAKQEVEDLLAAWLASVDNRLWNSLTTAFNQNNIQLGPFTSPQTFNTALNNYVDGGIEISLESNSEEDYRIYRNFRDFWNNTVKASWGEALVDGNILSQSEITAIDIKLNNWGEAAQPSSRLMFILFLVSIAIIIGLIVLLVMKRR
ncbi:MAG: hypothetical protein EA391_13595 [Balneolaceae bacterium]|nr:MAG: hypothetical protein EA391_13595 [Balneolaceae bacterium]